MRLRIGLLALAASASALGIAGVGSTTAAAAAVATCPSTPTASRTGHVGSELRQASGLTTVATSPGVLFTHNDRGLRDSPQGVEDTTYAAVWAIAPDGTPLARFRLTAHGAPIPYFDTEAISTDREGRIVLADTGTNVDQRVTVALYRLMPLPKVTPGQPFVSVDWPADVIPIQYFNAAKGGAPIKLNVEAFTIDATDAAWFIARTGKLPYSYTASMAVLGAAVGSTTPARVVRSSRLAVDGPMTDASTSPDGTTLLVKTPKVVYHYSVGVGGVAMALKATPCALVTAANKNAAGFGEAVVVANDGSFYTVAESSKSLPPGGVGAPIWSFTG